MEFIGEQVQENLGMVLVFSVISAAIEWLGNKSHELKTQREEDEQRRKEAEEEAERVIMKHFGCIVALFVGESLKQLAVFFAETLRGNSRHPGELLNVETQL